MNFPQKIPGESESEEARRRLLRVPGDPFLFADWESVVFLHFAIAANALQPFVRPPLQLDLYEGKACLTIVALTMRHFQPVRPFSLAAALRPVACQHFLNFRTYVHHREEHGAQFLWGWLSNPLPFPVPTFELPCSTAEMDYQHNAQSGQLRGVVADRSGQFSYHATINPDSFVPANSGSLAHFALERYTGYFAHKNHIKSFRAWHPAWLQTSIGVRIEEDRLLTNKFAWFKEAQFVGASFAPGFKHVWLGRVHSLEDAIQKAPTNRRGLCTLLEMP